MDCGVKASAHRAPGLSRGELACHPARVRGYFGIGVDRVDKLMNVGALLRTAHAFGASFFFTIGAQVKASEVRKSDTSKGAAGLPFYEYADADQFTVPRHCQLIGIELTDDAISLPSFYHPPAAAYVLGPEWGSLSPELVARCQQVVKIPTKFCVNVGIAGAIVMYDRLLATARLPERVMSMRQAPTEPPAHVHGDRVMSPRRGGTKS